MLRSAVLLTLRIVFWCRAARFAVLRPIPPDAALRSMARQTKAADEAAAKWW